METHDELTAELRENLVAYLDGELDEEATREIEQLLVRSASARREVAELTRSWEALDVLPRARASDVFTEKTLTSIRLAAAGEPTTATPWAVRLKRVAFPLTWAALLAAVAVFGYSLTHEWIPTETDLLVENLPMIERLHVYREVGDVKFLEQLRDEGVLQSLSDSSAAQNDERTARP